MKMPASTIHIATVLYAVELLNEQGINPVTAQQVSEITLRPKGYDMGGRLYNMSKAATAYIEKEDDGHFNTYSITDAGTLYLKNNQHRVQTFGEFEALGEQSVKNTPSSLALQAANEIQEIISLHTKLRTQLQRYHQTAILMEKDLEE